MEIIAISKNNEREMAVPELGPGIGWSTSGVGNTTSKLDGKSLGLFWHQYSSSVSVGTSKLEAI